MIEVERKPLELVPAPPLKPSEAIRQGAKLVSGVRHQYLTWDLEFGKPQGCALSAGVVALLGAREALDRMNTEGAWIVVLETFPTLGEGWTDCLTRACPHGCGEVLDTPAIAAIHLFDEHKFTIEQVADYLERLGY